MKSKIHFGSMSVSCPKCGAKPNRGCTRKDGTGKAQPHTERVEKLIQERG